MPSRGVSAVASALVLAAFCAGCAGIAPEAGEEHQDKVYRTGSNLPQKDRNVLTADPDSVRDATRVKGVGTIRGGGG